mmetsp:Transcript_13063/g.18344  ORF Transcript_13063/g.18344 Transcript_13063/m.18344 type:complete len:218 (+) Transcript_13063:19-672(+)
MLVFHADFFLFCILLFQHSTLSFIRTKFVSKQTDLKKSCDHFMIAGNDDWGVEDEDNIAYSDDNVAESYDESIIIDKKRGRPKKAQDEDETEIELPKRKDKVQPTPLIKHEETLNPNCRAHLVLFHTGSEDDKDLARQIVTSAVENFGEKLNIYEEIVTKEMKVPFYEVWLEGPSVIRLYSKDVRLESEINHFDLERIIEDIEEEVCDNAEFTYGPF